MNKPTQSQLRKKADAIFSKYIRQRDGGICYTCGLKREWKALQCGHFVPRQYLSLRYDETNCHSQCYACNMLFNGQPSAFASRLRRDFGKEIVETLEGRRKEIHHGFDYEGIILRYREKCKELRYEI